MSAPIPRQQPVLRAVLVAVLVAMIAACSGPGVRFATPAQSQQAVRAASPAASSAPGSASPSAATSPTRTASGNAGSPAGSGALAQFQAQLRQVADRVVPSVVQIRTDSGEGSGIVLDTHGNVVTNAHVVQGTGSLTVITSDGRQHKASLVGTYSQNDLAVVRVGDTGGLKPAGFADSSQVKVGDIVLAVGSPFGLADTVTEGIVSATGRTQSEQNGVTLVDLIQTSAGINPGNSGGALVDINGKVIGIPTLSSVDAPQRGQPSENIGFAIPGKQVQDISSQLITKGTVAHTGRAYLGISSRSDPNGGVRVVSTVANGPAAAAGIQPGSVITDLGGHPVADSNSLSQALAAYKPGDVVEVTLTLPDGSTQVVSVKVGERPTTP